MRKKELEVNRGITQRSRRYCPRMGVVGTCVDKKEGEAGTRQGGRGKEGRQGGKVRT